MPTYLYKDPGGYVHEVVFRMGEAPAEMSVRRGDGQPETWTRVFTSVAAIFRGGGWAGKS